MAAIAWIAGVLTIFFYVAFTTVLQVAFYRRRSAETRAYVWTARCTGRRGTE